MKTQLKHIVIFSIFLISACGDPCKDVVCGPGSCDDGTCICPEGYLGNSCEILENEQYFGLFEITNLDCSTGTTFSGETFTLGHKEGGGPFDVTLLIDDDPLGPLEGTLQDGKLDVSGSPLGFQTKVIGDFADVNTFSGTVTTDFIFLVECDFTMEK